MASQEVDADALDSLREVKATDNAIVQGVVANVSPLKKGQSSMYFDAKLTDGADQMRVVGFSSALRKRMAALEERCEPVALGGCKVKQARYSDQLEIMINPSTKITTSPKKFDLKKVNKMITGEVSVADIDSKSAYEKVTVRVKVLRVQPPTDVSSVLRKQQVTVADATGAIKVTLWEGSIGLLKEDISYELKNFTVRM